MPLVETAQKTASSVAPTAIAAAIALMAGTSSAQSDSSPPATPLSEITNTATRTDRRTDEVPATVTVTPAAQAEARGARDLKDWFRHEVDLSVRAAAPRFSAAGSAAGRAGNEGVNIRGLEGNQVLMLVDGIRVPNSFSFGAFATGRADFLALDNARAVEVLRGPASTQFGSDGLAGAVALRTLDPGDLLTEGRKLAGFVRLSGTQLDDSLGATAGVAARSGAWDGLLSIGARDGGETRTQGRNEAPNSTRTAPNPLDYRQVSLLGKSYLTLTPAHRFGVTVEAVRRRQTSDVISARTAPPATDPLPPTAVLALAARDEVERTRASLSHRFEDLNAAWLQKVQTQLYAQDSEVRQRSLEDRNAAADRKRDNRYREKLIGASTLAEVNLVAPLAQRLSGGIDVSRTQVSALRDGSVPPAGEAFPVKPFPDTNYTLAGAFVQSELALGSATLLPALRFDAYRLRPSAEGYAGGDVVALSDRAFTPRLGVVWRALPAFAPYAQWSRGFRAPTPDQVNNGFTNVASGYRSIGNPTLEPERAESIEIGVRGEVGALRWQAAAYDNRYRDFISQQVVGGSFTPADPAVFQFINLDNARIRGAELRASWQPSASWLLRGAAAAVRANSRSNGATAPLISEEPAKLSLGAQYRHGPWTLRGDLLHARAKSASRTPAQPAPPPPAAAGASFAPPSYTVLDLGVGWQPWRAWSVHLNVDNVFDKTYWRWSDVRGLADDSAVKEALTAAGRTVSVVTRWEF